MSIIHIVRGLPGTGKTTFVQKQFPGMLQIENDQFWITGDGKYEYGTVENPREACDNYVKVMAMTAMQQKVNFAVSRVGCSERSVRELVELAKTFNYDFHIWRMSSENTAVFHNVHNVPDDAMKFMKDNFVDILPWKQTMVGITLEAVDEDFDRPSPPPKITYDFLEIPGREGSQ